VLGSYNIITAISQSNDQHCIILKHVLHYLKGSLNRALCFTKCDDGLKLTGYSDASWGSSDERKSITGYCFSLNKNGPLISWKSRKQPTVAISSCEAEYMALAATTQETLFLTQLLYDIDRDCQYEPLTIFDDNQGAVALVENPVHHQPAKHIDIKYHFVCTEFSQGKINVVYLPSEDMVADIFTKSVSRHQLDKFKDFLFGKWFYRI